MFMRRLQHSWPRIRTSLESLLGTQTQVDILLRTIDGPVCRQPRILRKTAIFFGTSALIFASAAWVTNRQEARWWARALQDQPESSDGRRCGPVSKESGPSAIRMHNSLNHLRTWYSTHIVGLPPAVFRILHEAYRVTIWRHVQRSDAYRVFQIITGIHIGILFASFVPRCRPLIMKHLAHHGLSGRSYTYFTTPFVHIEPLHLVVNTIGFYTASIGLEYAAAHDGASPEWSYTLAQVAAFWVISGAFSIYFPEVISLIAFQRAIRRLPSKGAPEPKSRNQT